MNTSYLIALFTDLTEKSSDVYNVGTEVEFYIGFKCSDVPNSRHLMLSTCNMLSANFTMDLILWRRIETSEICTRFLGMKHPIIFL